MYLERIFGGHPWIGCPWTFDRKAGHVPILTLKTFIAD